MADKPAATVRKDTVIVGKDGSKGVAYGRTTPVKVKPITKAEFDGKPNGELKNMTLNPIKNLKQRKARLDQAIEDAGG